jgi:uncharacterized protein YebE (UPF0316 family)
MKASPAKPDGGGWVMLRSIELFLQGRSIWVYCVVFFGKLIEVSLATLRSQLIIKGQRWTGALCAAFEFSFWVVITANVLGDFASDPLRVFLLIAAYSLGQMLGSWLESKLALGNCMLSVIFMEEEKACDAETFLRAHGFALTRFHASGRDQCGRTVLLMTIKRKFLPFAKQLIHQADAKAVVAVMPSVEMEGGTLLRATPGK